MSDFKVALPDGRELKYNYIKNSDEAQDILASFHERSGTYCKCLCNGEITPKLAIKKRTKLFLAAYPNTSYLHNNLCPHYQPAPEILTANDSLTNGARKEVGGRVYLSCEVGLTRRAPREEKVPGDEDSTKSAEEKAQADDEDESDKKRKISLSALLLKFWLDAQVNQWVPTIADKRYWGTIRARIMESTKAYYINKLPMSKGLYLPMTWKPDHAEQIIAAKEAFFSQWRGLVNNDFLAIGELKDIEPSEHGYVFKLKNENSPFYISNDLYDSLVRKFQFEISVFETNQRVDEHIGKVVVIMSCNMPSKYITIRNIALMATSNQYIPALSKYELTLFNQLVAENRTFIRPAKLDLEENHIPDAVLLDAKEQVVIGVFDDSIEDFDNYAKDKAASLESSGLNTWFWRTHEHDVPNELPAIYIDA
ncbi:MAG: DUF1173 family protein [Gammaproteobacteria bacterium]|nr:MAG: DUF1173 family protein [Gammaproteobacteria bacterium]